MGRHRDGRFRARVGDSLDPAIPPTPFRESGYSQHGSPWTQRVCAGTDGAERAQKEPSRNGGHVPALVTSLPCTHRSPAAGRARFLIPAIDILSTKLKIPVLSQYFPIPPGWQGALLTPHAVVLNFACKERDLMALTREYRQASYFTHLMAHVARIIGFLPWSPQVNE